MKTAPGPLITLLNASSRFLMADLYAITLHDGTVYYWTSADTAIVYPVGGQSYACAVEGGTAVPLIKRGPTKTVLGLEVDELEITLSQGAAQVLLGGIPLALAAANGAFDDANVVVTRVFMSTWGDTTPGGVVLFSGAVAHVEPTSTTVKLSLKSDLDKLLVAMPRNLFSPACTHALFDSGCNLTRASYVSTGTIAGSPTPTAISFATNLTQADAYFQLGVLIMTSGPASGSRAAVKSYLNAAGSIILALPLAAAPVAGNTFSIIPGCDKTQATCTTKFSNLARFRGFPFIPKPESAR
jgi:uncharacterized phage protein (TIGR02218 family)